MLKEGLIGNICIYTHSARQMKRHEDSNSRGRYIDKISIHAHVALHCEMHRQYYTALRKDGLKTRQPCAIKSINVEMQFRFERLLDE